MRKPNIMKSKILIFAFLLTLIGCSSSNDFEVGKKQLESQGYTEIKNTGYKFICCGEEDRFSTGFTAIDKSGNKAEGCFCSTFFKGITIKFK
jgi:hypothetical protein